MRKSVKYILLLSIVTLAFLVAATGGPNAGKKIYIPIVQNQLSVGNPITPTATLLPSLIPTGTNTALPTFTSTPTATATARPTRTPRPTATPSTAPSAQLIAAGDIARCGGGNQADTAAIISRYPSAIVAPLGDNAYESGSPTEYATCYNPSWGAFLNRTRPAPGNHDFLTPGGTGYYDYYGASAGTPGKGYYSYTLGAWHIVVLNSNCGDAGGCTASSPQGSWLKSDLAAHPAQCTLAYFHHPLFSSGQWGDTTWMQPLVQLLYDAGTDVMLSGHDHDYERFAPQNPSGSLDQAKGIVQFVAGTGGSNHTPWTTVQPNSQVRDNSSFGVLLLTLNASGYSWQFIPVSGSSFKDSGTASCH